MKKKLLLSLLFYESAVAVCFSQKIVVSAAANVPRVGDVCVKQQVDYFSCGESGHGVLWDFRDLNVGEKFCYTYCVGLNDSVFVCADSERMCKYQLSNDTLFVLGYETPQIAMSYNVPQVYMTYPFGYGCCISNNFEGSGRYCGELLMLHCGTMIVEADAEGSVMVADGDTLCNVIRVHTLSTNSLGMYAATDTLLSDSSNVKQEIEEKYSWYVRGYRYPMYETVCVSYYDKMNPVSSIRKAYRYLPYNQSFLKDSVNERMLMEDSLALENGLDVFRYGVEYCNGTLKVVYDADIDVSIDALVCNKQGVLYMRKKECQLTGSDYQMTFDCTGLRNDEYILYMNVNGKVYSEKFQVR